jgi:hypothetical protein
VLQARTQRHAHGDRPGADADGLAEHAVDAGEDAFGRPRGQPAGGTEDGGQGVLAGPDDLVTPAQSLGKAGGGHEDGRLTIGVRDRAAGGLQ